MTCCTRAMAATGSKSLMGSMPVFLYSAGLMAWVLLMVTKIHAFSGRVHWGLMGSACICFSIGCLARTSVGLHDMAQRAKQESAAALDRTSA